MVSVIQDRRGTAWWRLRGYNIPTAAKTGTAESGDGAPHAWFAGYTMAEEDTGLPDIAIAVILEHAGEGSDYAAPVFRRIAESYYYGSPKPTIGLKAASGHQNAHPLAAFLPRPRNHNGQKTSSGACYQIAIGFFNVRTPPQVGEDKDGKIVTCQLRDGSNKADAKAISLP